MEKRQRPWLKRTCMTLSWKPKLSNHLPQFKDLRQLLLGQALRPEILKLQLQGRRTRSLRIISIIYSYRKMRANSRKRFRKQKLLTLSKGRFKSRKRSSLSKDNYLILPKNSTTQSKHSALQNAKLLLLQRNQKHQLEKIYATLTPLSFVAKMAKMPEISETKRKSSSKSPLQKPRPCLLPWMS